MFLMIFGKTFFGNAFFKTRAILTVLVHAIMLWITALLTITQQHTPRKPEKEHLLSTQSTPSPLKPGLHVQLKDPIVSVQLALSWQLWRWENWHSLTEIKQSRMIWLRILDCFISHSDSLTPMKRFQTNCCGLCADLLAFELNGEMVSGLPRSPLL